MKTGREGAGPVPEPARIAPDLATASRRAAALYVHWNSGELTVDGVEAVLSEITSGDEWANLALALPNLTDGLVEAARDGREDEYAAYVLREAMLGEVNGA